MKKGKRKKKLFIFN